ncbi:MAG: TRAP transporter small permease [Ferrovibrio sp.]|nr:TRAP transporter small permease [Ferrovibrio sp.]
MQAFIDLVRWMSRVSGVVSTLLILVSILVVCQMIFVRTVLGESSIWQTEFVTFGLIAATFVGAPYILMTHGHVNVDLLPLYLSHAARIRLALFASIMALGFCVLVTWNGAHWWLEAFEGGHVTSSMWRARLWIPYLAVPVGMGLLCLQYVADILCLLTGRGLPFGLKPEDGI